MAIGRDAASLLELIRLKSPGSDSILTLGRQSMALLPSEIQATKSLDPKVDEKLITSMGNGDFADSYLTHLGFRTITSLDASNYEDCSLIHDLNQPIPEHLHQHSDIVFDGGTLEHVFHFPNAISNAMNLVKEGGYFIACCPSNNFNGHGFYQFSPELFFRILSPANGFRVHLMCLAETRSGGCLYSVTDPETIHTRVGLQGNGPIQLLVVASRDAIHPVLQSSPQQSDYLNRWDDLNGEKTLPASTPLKKIKTWARKALPQQALEQYDLYWTRKRRRKERCLGLTRVPDLESCWNSLPTAPAATAQY